MQRKYFTILITSAFTIAAAMLTVTRVEAGQPWSCLCDGKIKRTIASTYACEASLYRGTGRRVHEGFKLFVPACTGQQFRAWNRRACASIGCTLVPR